jgi:hypothetical protein
MCRRRRPARPADRRCSRLRRCRARYSEARAPSLIAGGHLGLLSWLAELLSAAATNADALWLALAVFHSAAFAQQTKHVVLAGLTHATDVKFLEANLILKFAYGVAAKRAAVLVD